MEYDPARASINRAKRRWRAAQEPGRITTEFAVSRAALKLDPAEMAAVRQAPKVKF